jgi:hypothetical protein
MQPRVIFITIVAALLFAVAVTAAIHPTAHLSDADYAEYSMHIFKENHQARIEESKMKSGSGGDGLDISSLHSEMTQSCMVGKGYQFMIPRAYQSSGHVDPNVLANLRNAHTVGFKYVDVYFFPCPKCSKSPAAQVAEFAQGLAGAKYVCLFVGSVFLFPRKIILFFSIIIILIPPLPLSVHPKPLTFHLFAQVRYGLA